MSDENATPPPCLIDWRQPTDLSPRVVSFFVLLPEALPFPSGSTTSLQIQTADAVGRTREAPLPNGNTMRLGPGLTFTWMRFWQIPQPAGLDPRALAIIDSVLHQVIPALALPDPDRAAQLSDGPDPEPHDGMATVLEMTTGVVVPTRKAVEQAFELCFHQALQADRCLRVSQRRASTRLTLPRVHQIVPTAIRHLDGIWESRLLTLVAHHELPQPEAPTLLDEAGLERYRTHFHAMSSGHPMVLYWDRRLQGVAAYDKGDYEEAILWSAVAAEILLDALLAVMLWEDGATAAAAARIFAKPLARRVDADYHERLGASDWRRTDDSPVALWYTRLAATRNRIVHRGHTPHHDEATQSATAGEELADFIVNCVRRCREERRLTADIILGEPITQSKELVVPLRSLPIEHFLRWADELDAEEMRLAQSRRMRFADGG